MVMRGHNSQDVMSCACSQLPVSRVMPSGRKVGMVLFFSTPFHVHAFRLVTRFKGQTSRGGGVSMSEQP